MHSIWAYNSDNVYWNLLLSLTQFNGQSYAAPFRELTTFGKYVSSWQCLLYEKLKRYMHNTNTPDTPPSTHRQLVSPLLLFWNQCRCHYLLYDTCSPVSWPSKDVVRSKAGQNMRNTKRLKHRMWIASLWRSTHGLTRAI
jgi:hypothetical protein